MREVGLCDLLGLFWKLCGCMQGLGVTKHAHCYSGLLLRNLILVTIIQKPSYLLYITTLVTQIEFLNGNPGLLSQSQCSAQ